VFRTDDTPDTPFAAPCISEQRRRRVESLSPSWERRNKLQLGSMERMRSGMRQAPLCVIDAAKSDLGRVGIAGGVLTREPGKDRPIRIVKPSAKHGVFDMKHLPFLCEFIEVTG
jgi:hypothetical protein